MLECLINDQPKSLDSGLKTWGEVLSHLEPELAETRHSVTAVRFDGVDQPSFFSPDLAETPLGNFERIEVETSDRRRLLRSTLGTANESLPRLSAAACRTASAFRGRDLADAHRQLAGLIECVRTLTLLTIASAAASDTTLENLSCGSHRASYFLGRVSIALDTLAQWQDGQDWPGLADALENDLAPALLQWGVVFEAMHDRCAA
jgi:hypothetical protein